MSLCAALAWSTSSKPPVSVLFAGVVFIGQFSCLAWMVSKRFRVSHHELIMMQVRRFATSPAIFDPMSSVDRRVDPGPRRRRCGPHRQRTALVYPVGNPVTFSESESAWLQGRARRECLLPFQAP